MSQTEKLYNLLKSGNPVSTDTIIRVVYPAEGRLKTPARISARIYDVKHRYGVDIISYEDAKIEGLWWYRLETTPPKPSQSLPALCVEEVMQGQRALFPLTKEFFCDRIGEEIKTMSNALQQLNDYKSLHSSWLKANASVMRGGQLCKLL